MSLWIAIALTAAVFQTLRFMLQKVLSVKTLSTAGATFARFAYSAPLVALGMTLYLSLTGQGWPALSGRFWSFALTGGLAQILATICVVALFRTRNFAVGITLKNTEVLLTALVGLVVLGDRVSAAGLGAILLGVAGVVLLSDAQVTGALWRRLGNRAAALGLGAGLLFAVSGVTYRGATLAIGSDDAFLRAGVTLAMVTASQTLAMVLWLAWREPGQITAVWAARRRAVWVGLTSLGGSLGWFWAFTLQNAAYVKALGQIELVLSLMASILFFHEKVSRRELLGIALILASILTLVLAI